MSTGNNVSVFFVTEAGKSLAEKLLGLYPGASVKRFSRQAVLSGWKRGARLVFIMATGIVLRTIAALIKDKKTDPAVVVLDEKGEYAISLLSGHLGGANETAREIARYLQARPVITTASDLHALPGLDLWAQEHGLRIDNWRLLPKIGTKLVNTGGLRIYSDIGIDLPPQFSRTTRAADADVIISSRQEVRGRSMNQALYLRPQVIALGIGCNRGTSEDEIRQEVSAALESRNISMLSVCAVGTVVQKKDEGGLASFAQSLSVPLVGYTADELNAVQGVSTSDAALRATGAKAVAEPAAVLASGGGRLIMTKKKAGNLTVAAAERPRSGTEAMSAGRKGSIMVIGTGPGSIEHITPYAQDRIRQADVIVGYGTYLDLISGLLVNKEVLSTGMTQEIDRCRAAIDLAMKGKNVAVISGGDPGVYAMAGLVLELLKKEVAEGSRGRGIRKMNAPSDPRILGSSRPAVEIVPGISALNACAARLGAPLMHDFCAISLSDRLTPWETIEKRLDAAGSADFVISLYNPKSKGRAGHIGAAQKILLRHRSPDTPVGIVKGAMRENESVVITDLGHMAEADIDMQTTVIIGNSHTFRWNGLMVTPRGYEKKKQFHR
ncbi:MAG: precorrin-3B C(17)-methyltransferase [Thermodesulfovibrionales bacterium]